MALNSSELWPGALSDSISYTEHTFPAWFTLHPSSLQFPIPHAAPGVSARQHPVLSLPASRAALGPAGLYLPVGPGVAPPVSRVDLVAAETAQLDPVRKSRGSLVRAPQRGAIPGSSASGWRRIGIPGARLLHGDRCRPAGGKMAKRKKESWENTL